MNMVFSRSLCPLSLLSDATFSYATLPLTIDPHFFLRYVLSPPKGGGRWALVASSAVVSEEEQLISV